MQPATVLKISRVAGVEEVSLKLPDGSKETLITCSGVTVPHQLQKGDQLWYLSGENHAGKRILVNVDLPYRPPERSAFDGLELPERASIFSDASLEAVAPTNDQALEESSEVEDRNSPGVAEVEQSTTGDRSEGKTQRNKAPQAPSIIVGEDR